jgi:hypothetical protein
MEADGMASRDDDAVSGSEREGDAGLVDFEVDQGEDMPPLPYGAPPDFRVRVALALKTTDVEVLAAAEDGYRGQYVDVHDFLVHMLDPELPAHLRWILDCTDRERLRAGYEREAILVWEIRISDERALIFESLRAGTMPFEVPCGEGRVTVYGARVGAGAGARGGRPARVRP